MEGEQPQLGDLLTMVINHLLTGMTLQVRTNILECPWNWAGTHFRKLAIEPNHRVAGPVALSFREGHLVKPLTLLSSIFVVFFFVKENGVFGRNSTVADLNFFKKRQIGDLVVERAQKVKGIRIQDLGYP